MEMRLYKELIVMPVKGKVTRNIRAPAESPKHIPSVPPPPLCPFSCGAHVNTGGSQRRNSKVTDAPERAVSHHTSVVQHGSQVRRDVVGSAC